jgi:RNA polymerase-binding protein DksA
MARSTTRSLAGKAASAARKAMSRRAQGSARGTQNGAAPAKATAGEKTAAVAKTAPAKKEPAKKAPAKKAAAKAAPAKKAAVKKSAAKAPAKKPPAKNAAAEKPGPSKRTTSTKAPPVKKTASKKAPPAKKSTPPTKKPAPAATTTTKAAALKRADTDTLAAPPARAKKTSGGRKGAVNPADLPVLPGEKPWTKAEVDEVISDLNDDRARAIRTLAAQEEELAGLMRDAGDGAGHDQADMGATSFERDQELTVLNNEREKLAQIDRALGRIADGSYGICESCGNPIGKGRSMAFPRATLCLTCKQREERR